MTPFRFRPFWGMGVGVLFAIVLMMYFMVREQLLGDVSLWAQGETLEQVIAMYLVAGMMGGLLLGVLLPWARDPLGAVVVGIIVVMPFFVLQAWVDAGRPGGEREIGWWSVVVGSALVGGLAGYLIRTRLFAELDR